MRRDTVGERRNHTVAPSTAAFVRMAAAALDTAVDRVAHTVAAHTVVVHTAVAHRVVVRRAVVRRAVVHRAVDFVEVRESHLCMQGLDNTLRLDSVDHS